MWDRIRIGRSLAGRSGDGAGARPGRRSARLPLVETLEDRRLPASLAALPNITVPAQQGETVPLDGSGTTDGQTFTVTSSNPDIVANVVSGPFWTVNVQYTDPTNSANDFSGPLVFQLFNSADSETLTPNTVQMITNFTNDGYYSNTGKYITRIAPNFPGATDYVIQGGAATTDGTGSSGQPGTPFANENVQQLAFTGSDQLAMANSGGTDSNDTQFFITTGQPNSELGYNYTIFGQMIPNPTSSSTPSDQTTLAKLTQIPVTDNDNFNPPEDSLPVYNPIITSTSLSDAYPSGTLLIDTTSATAGETGTITVTANDPATGTSTTQTFTVTVGSYTGPTSSSLITNVNFKPLATATTATTSESTPVTVSLAGQGTFPVSGVNQDLTYSLVSQPSNGTITDFNPSTGTLNYTPKPGYSGTDTFQYTVTANGPNTAPAATSNPGTVSVTVSPTVPVDTGAVRVVNTVLIVTPVPTWNLHAHNKILVTQVTPSGSTSPVIQVYVNGQLDVNQPSVDSIDDIIVFGSRANDRITIDPSVTVPSVIDGGHGGKNVLKAGSTETLEHGWFGHNVMIGGSGPNQLIGRAGHVKFRPTKSTDLIFAGQPNKRTALLYPTPPSGTFYVYKKGRLIPVPLSNLYPSTTTKRRTHTGPDGNK